MSECIWSRAGISSGMEEGERWEGSLISCLKKLMAALQPRHTNIKRDLLITRKKSPSNKKPIATSTAFSAHH